MRNISIRRGLRHLGFLPRKKRSLRTIPRSSVHLPAEAVMEEEETDALALDAKFSELFKQVSAEVDKRHHPLRSSVPYFYQRQFFQVLDALPAPFTVGLDFEFILRKL